MTRSSVEKAIDITATFEGSRGYSSLGGNFDGQGISFGLLQWNAGQGTLQPILRNCLEHMPDTMKSIFGNNDLYILKKKLETNQCFFEWSKTLSYRDARGQTRIVKKWYDYFVALGQNPGCQKFQRQAMAGYIKNSIRIMKAYGFKSERALALCLDIAVQNGSVINSARSLYRASTTTQITEVARLKVLGDAVANTAKWQFRADVRSRKTCIVKGKGYVHGSYRVLDLTDEPATFGEFAL